MYRSYYPHRSRESTDLVKQHGSCKLELDSKNEEEVMNMSHDLEGGENRPLLNHCIYIRPIVYIFLKIYFCCWKRSHYCWTNLTVGMEPQLMNLIMRLTPNFLSKWLEKLGLSFILKLISSGSIPIVRYPSNISPHLQISELPYATVFSCLCSLQFS